MGWKTSEAVGGEEPGGLIDRTVLLKLTFILSFSIFLGISFFLCCSPTFPPPPPNPHPPGTIHFRDCHRWILHPHHNA